MKEEIMVLWLRIRGGMGWIYRDKVVKDDIFERIF